MVICRGPALRTRLRLARGPPEPADQMMWLGRFLENLSVALLVPLLDLSPKRAMKSEHRFDQMWDVANRGRHQDPIPCAKEHWPDEMSALDTAYNLRNKAAHGKSHRKIGPHPNTGPTTRQDRR